MISFKEKTYGKKIGMMKESVIKGVTNPVALASLGIGGTGLYLNYKTKKATEKRNIEADRQHAEVLRQNERLIRALGGVEKGLQNIPQQPEPKKQETVKDDSWLRVGGRKIFSEKKTPTERSYGNVFNDAVKGSALGASLGGFVSPWMPGNKAKVAGVLLGGALGGLVGSLWGTVKTLDTAVSQSMTGHKLLSEVIKNLERAGYKREQDWTTDAKRATFMKTKVCLVISQRSSDELGVLVNMVADPKLKEVSGEILRKLPKDAQKTEKVSDRFNDIQISSFPSSQDPVYIFSIIEGFIKSGFPVYLIEVG